MQHLIIILTQTPSKFGKLIRRVLHQQYNHISISLDEDLREIYAFARKKNSTPIDGGLVNEALPRFTLGNNIPIPAKVYQIPVDNIQYHKIENIIAEIKHDPGWRYNLFSALSYPFFGGFSTYKAFTCVEFGGYILDSINFSLVKRPCKYTPEELADEIEPYLIYQGDLSVYHDFKDAHGDPTFFEKDNLLTKWKKNMIVLSSLSARILYRRQ